MSTAAAETTVPQLRRLHGVNHPRLVRTPLDVDGRELGKTPDGEHYVDPNTGAAFTKNGLKKYCKWQERLADAAARAETRAKKAAETKAAPAPAPGVGLAEQHADLVAALENLEMQLRLRHRPTLDIRVPASASVVARTRSFREARHVAGASGGGRESAAGEAADTVMADVTDEGASASFTGRGLRQLALAALPPPPPPPAAPVVLRSLDLSQNELTALPAGFGSVPALAGLTSLSLKNNWFREVPGEEIGALRALTSLSLQGNFLRPSTLALTQLKALPKLTALDLRYNELCAGRAALHSVLATKLPGLKSLQLSGVPGSLQQEPGAFVGKSAAERDASLLRAQLEPYGTTVLRARLLADFGQEELEPDAVTGEPAGRAAVMAALLSCYAEEEAAAAALAEPGVDDECEDAGGGRKLVRVSGTPVPPDILAELLTELRAWSGSTERNRREREICHSLMTFGSDVLLRAVLGHFCACPS